MVPPMREQASIMPINTLKEELELEEKELVCAHKKSKFTESVVQQQQETEVLSVEGEHKGHDDPSLKDSACVVQSNGEANGCSEELLSGSTNKELPARLRLAQLCSTIGWKCPTYDFEDQGFNHTKLFTCKVTVHVETYSDTVVECCSEPKPQKNAAQEQAAQGVLWCLKCLGHVK
ncbi:hypothetical protein ACQ4PT_028483 [Festuca glaucescens]